MSLGTGIFLSTVIISVLLLYRWTSEKYSWRKGLKKIGIGLTLLVLAVTLLSNLNNLYERYTISAPESYYGIKLGMSKDEVEYLRGVPENESDKTNLDTERLADKNTDPFADLIPTENIGSGLTPEEKQELRLLQELESKNEARNNLLMKSESLKNHASGRPLKLETEWTYRKEFEPELIVSFDSAGEVVGITCLGHYHSGCDSVLGVNNYSSEEDVIRKLGEPDKTELLRGIKKMTYRDFNLIFLLEKGQVSVIRLEHPRQNI